MGRRKMVGKRKHFTPEFKFKVVLESLHRNGEESDQARDAQVWHRRPAQTQEVCLPGQSH